MPMKPMRPCNHVGCSALTRERHCEKHKQQIAQQYDRERGTAHQRGYDTRWRRASKMFLRSNPLCACDECKKRAVPLPANVVDHIIPHKGDYELFWDESNWQPMNKRCHDRKTATEDGGFGR